MLEAGVRANRVEEHIGQDQRETAALPRAHPLEVVDRAFRLTQCDEQRPDGEPAIPIGITGRGQQPVQRAACGERVASAQGDERDDTSCPRSLSQSQTCLSAGPCPSRIAEHQADHRAVDL